MINLFYIKKPCKGQLNIQKSINVVLQINRIKKIPYSSQQR